MLYAFQDTLRRTRIPCAAILINYAALFQNILVYRPSFAEQAKRGRLNSLKAINMLFMNLKFSMPSSINFKLHKSLAFNLEPLVCALYYFFFLGLLLSSAIALADLVKSSWTSADLRAAKRTSSILIVVRLA